VLVTARGTVHYRDVSSKTIEEAGRLLAEAAHRPARILLFGSHARGRADAGSDLDLLVIEPVEGSRHREMVRLRAALDPLRVPADVVVVTEEHVEAWGSVPGTLIHAALSEGRVLAET
jgi:uncharacterized protein